MSLPMTMTLLWACRPEAPPPAPDGASAELEALSIGAPLEPAFASDILAYAVPAAELGDPLPLDVVPEDPEAEITLSRLSVSDGAVLEAGLPYPPDEPLVLLAGERLELHVTASDGTTGLTYAVTALPDDYPPLRTERYGETSPGQLLLGLLTPVSEGVFYGVALDDRGVPDWYRVDDAGMFDLRAGAGGHLSLVRWDHGLLLDPDTRAEVAEVHPPDLRGEIPLVVDVHELFELEDGTLWELGEYAVPEDLTPVGGPADGRVLHHALQEVAPDGTVRFAWSTEGALEYVRVPFWMWDPELEAWDYSHLNSASLDPDDGNLVVSLRIVSQVLKIARHPTTVGGHTFAPGEVIWRLGAGAPMRFVGDDRLGAWQGFAGQHSVRPVPGGRLQVFDNALWRVRHGETLDEQEIDIVATGRPRMVEYAIDEVAQTATYLRSFETEADPIRAGGSVQELDDGHLVSGWGDLSRGGEHPAVTELDADGAVVREVWMAPDQWSYRAWLVPPAASDSR
ncbi:MAG: arylsulfotransferase family protein [Myxococcota bacterium]